MSNTGTIKISLKIDDKGSVRVLQDVGKESSIAGKKGKKAFKDMDKSAKSLNQTVKMSAGTLLKMGTAAASVAAGYALTKLYNESIKAASALEEVSSKYSVVFQGQTDIVDKWASNLVDKYAMSTREAKKYLSSVQDLLVPMGMQEKAAAELSNEMVKLAGDLGSFNDLPTQQVIENIQSALVGEYETMKKYGVVINATTVQQEALNMGLAETKDALTAADKAQAAYKLIVQSSTAAIGDMERTSDGYANTTKRLNSEWEDFTATLGEKFLPAASKIKSITADILDNLTKAIQEPSIDERLNTIADSIEKQIKMLERLGGSNLKNTKQYKALLANLESIRDVQEDTYLDAGKWSDGVETVNNNLKDTGGKLESIEKKLKSIKDIWGTGYDLDYGDDAVQAAIDNMLTSRNNEAIALKTNIDLQNRMALAIEDTYDLDSGKITDGFDNIKDTGESTAEALKNAFYGWANGFSSTLNDMVWEAEASFGNILESFGKMATQMMIQQSIVSPFVSGISGWFPSAKGNVFGPTGVHAFAQGGAFTNKIVDSPTLFAHGAGFGVMGEKGDEAIMPLTRTNSGDLGVQAVGSNNVELHFHNAPPVKETRRSRGNGGDRIDIFFEDKMAGILGGQNSATNALENKYGLSPVLVGR
jgi:hypothetical protein